MKEIGRQWGLMSEHTKAQYKMIANKDKERYNKQIEMINQLKTRISKEQLNRQTLTRPKKCLSAYMIFVREMRQRVTDENPDMKVLDVMKEVGHRWQNINPTEKAIYEAKSQSDKERFKQENAVYQRDLMNMQQILNTKIE